MAGDARRYPSRKRSHSEDGTEAWAEELLQAAMASKKMIIFSGSGLSATSGMSMFSTKNGLYQRAKKKFKLQDGMKLFCYTFYKQRKTDVQAFFAQIYSEAQASQAASGHYAIKAIQSLGKLQRHYTMNIDGLAEVVGLDIWDKEENPQGSTIEMHGNIRRLVCPECRATSHLTRVVINQMKAKKKIMCEKCNKSEVRFKVMLYDDDEGDCITPDHVFETLEEDLQQVDLLLWVGISFEQSASVEYFRKVRHMLSQHGRLQEVQQVIINPSDEALFNVMSASCNTEDLPIMEVKAASDLALPLLAEQLTQHLTQQGMPVVVAPRHPVAYSGGVKDEEEDDEAEEEGEEGDDDHDNDDDEYHHSDDSADNDVALPTNIPRRRRTALQVQLRQSGVQEFKFESSDEEEDDKKFVRQKEEDDSSDDEEEDGNRKSDDDVDADDSKWEDEEEEGEESKEEDEEEGDEEDSDDDERERRGGKRRHREAVEPPKFSLGVRPLPSFNLSRAVQPGGRSRRNAVAV